MTIKMNINNKCINGTIGYFTKAGRSPESIKYSDKAKTIR
jgi:hypothetical protein